VQCHLLAEILIVLVGNRLGGTTQAASGANPPAPGGDTPRQLRDLAWRISENRVVAGVHYMADIVEGKRLGEDLARYFITKVTPDSSGAKTPLQWLWTQAKREQVV
jgi:hypothetical protein